MEKTTQASFFGFHFVAGLLRHMGWPKRRSLLSSKAVIDSLVLDSVVNQMIKWAASLGACRSELALQMIATMFRGNDWDSDDSLSIQAAVNDSKELWYARGNSDPIEVVKPFRFSEKRKTVNATELNDNRMRFVLETDCFESLIWGLANRESFLQYFEESKNRRNDNLPSYEKMGLNIESIPGLDEFLASGEEILKSYEKEIRILSPIPPKLMKDAVALGIEMS